MTTASVDPVSVEMSSTQSIEVTDMMQGDAMSGHPK